MRRIGTLLALLVIASPALAQVEERDRAAEVRGGSEVHVLIEYRGSTTGSRTGAQAPYAMHEASRLDVAWEAQGTAHPKGDGTLHGSVQGSWSARASRDHTWDYTSESSTLHRTIACQGNATKEDGTAFSIDATPEATGLRVHVSGFAEPGMSVPGPCHQHEVETTVDGTDTRDATMDLERNVPLVHGFADGEYEADVTLLVPYDGTAQRAFRANGPVPSPSGSALAAYCEMSDSMAWSKGTCDAEGVVTIRVLVDPCPYIRTAYAKHMDALQAVPPIPPGADEAAIRAWDKGNAAKAQAVLADQRAWQIVGCDGELTPDPWEALERVLTLKRDALLELAKQGKLTREGAAECLGAERALQLIGSSSEADLSPILDMPSAPPSGSMHVSAHSPVSLHAWSESGGHVGWNATTNDSEATIPGARYEGAPGGPQTITLPAGYYRIQLDELSSGDFVLEVASEGTATDATDAYHGSSRAGRSASTHYAIVDGWEGARLEGYAARVGATPAHSSFRDAGAPTTGGGGATHGPDAGNAPPPGGAATPAGTGKNAPAPAVGVALAGVAVAAALVRLVRRR